MLAMRKRRMRWLVYLFPTQNSVSEASCGPLPPSPAPGHCRSWGNKGPGREVAWGRVWAACMEMKLSHNSQATSVHPNRPKASAASHSFIRGPTATGCPRRALPWIQLVADPIGAQLHGSLSCHQHCSPPPPCSRLDPLSAHHINPKVCFQMVFFLG